MSKSTSGLLKGGGYRRYRSKFKRITGKSSYHFPDLHLKDGAEIKRKIPDFDPDLEFE